jgi:hypothetical protein
MAVITATKVAATTNELTYTFTGTGADTGTITYASLVADAATGTSGTSTLKTVLQNLGGQCDSNAKAISALITGEQFTGAGTGTPSLTTNIEVKLVAATGTAIPSVTATDDGATNNPQITFATAGVGQCWLYIKRIHSIVQ